MSVSRVRENRTHGSMRGREALRCRWPSRPKGPASLPPTRPSDSADRLAQTPASPWRSRRQRRPVQRAWCSSRASVRPGSPEMTASTGSSSAPVDRPHPCAPLSWGPRCMPTRQSARRATMSNSLARRCARRRRSTLPRMSSSAIVAAMSCRRNWQAPRGDRSGWPTPSGAWTPSASAKPARSGGASGARQGGQAAPGGRVAQRVRGQRGL